MEMVSVEKAPVSPLVREFCRSDITCSFTINDSFPNEEGLVTENRSIDRPIQPSWNRWSSVWREKASRGRVYGALTITWSAVTKTQNPDDRNNFNVGNLGTTAGFPLHVNEYISAYENLE